MAMFRWADNVPAVYVDESRDFQLLCDSFDVVQNSVKYDIDSMLNVSITSLCPEHYIPLLQTKLGFDTNRQYSTETLRFVLQLFPLLCRKKGSSEGIQLAVLIFQKAVKLRCKSKVSIDDLDHTILISFNTTFVDTTLLSDLLRYVLPAGYRLKYEFYHITTPVTETRSFDMVYYLTDKASDSVVIKNDDGSESVVINDESTQRYTRYDLFGVGTTRIADTAEVTNED